MLTSILIIFLKKLDILNEEPSLSRAKEFHKTFKPPKNLTFKLFCNLFCKLGFQLTNVD